MTLTPRTYLQAGIAAIVIAVPLFAYANIEAAATSFGQPAHAAPAKPATPVDPDPLTVTCRQQHWPNYLAECGRGQHNPVSLRQIGLVSTDVPTSSLPRVIEAPVTRRRVVTADTKPHATRSESRRTVTRALPLRQMDRHRILPMPTTVSEIDMPARW